MSRSYSGYLPAVLLCAAVSVSQSAFPAPRPGAQSENARPVRKIEEVVVTAERRKSTAQHTPLAITALNTKMLQNFGIRNQTDLQDFIPATTIQPYDISIRGIGRLYRALGGDPGVATYVDGIYSEDFGIASTASGMYDLQRIEVMRGP